MRVDGKRREHFDRCLRRAVAAFQDLRGADAAYERALEIRALPSKEWRGVLVREVECEGPYGRGPHRQWIPEYVLWSLIDLRHFLCPFHR